ncbi:MAG: DUF2184 domain-containing protein [Desulfobacteraceae bacterium]|nr:DUF2184 domain-containing protein [Desulfobacteraceae bacterium]
MKLMLNGKEVQMDNFGADPTKNGFNRFAINAPTWNELPRTGKAHLNALSIDAAGYEHALTVLTQIKAQVIKQKFYEVNPSDFMPVVVGEGSWMQNLVFNSVYMNADDFESGIVDSSRPFNRKPTTDIEIIAKPVPIVSWNKAFSYSVIEVSQAAKGNVDLVSSIEEARKKNWDLGIQRTAFLGSKTKPDILGLYTAESVAVNTTFLGAPISGLDATNFQSLVAQILKLYSDNAASTVLPDTFLMPLSDYLGMATASSATFPVISKLEFLTNAFKAICGPNFKIGYTAYGDKARMTTAGVDNYRYILYRNQPETLELNIPVAYTTTTFGTANGFDFENVAMGQFSSVYAKRPLEMLYFDDVNTA